LTEIVKRRDKDRRERPTPAWNLYTFFGQRRWFRRKSDQEKGRYVDHSSWAVFLLLVLILGLNILDSLLTMMILDIGGKEFNPLVNSAILLLGDKFWVWKFTIISACLVSLCLHRGFRLFREIIIGVSCFYLVIVLYQIFLISHLTSPAWWFGFNGR